MSTAVESQASHSHWTAAALQSSTRLLERGLVPDWIARRAIRRLLEGRLEEEARGGVEGQSGYARQLIEQLKASPIALATREANEQHYEVPPRFFELVLGKRLKYSSGFWEDGCRTLDQAEEAMLSLTVE
ncbi:MAG TPA: hypothetical protein VGR96_10215, partial [Acidobacteriaceae bacterium]|nr:hypothetical protein [Acidobacteriaceae bacterium]